MTQGRKTGGRDFVKGQIANPKGAGAIDPALRNIRRLTRDEISEIGTLLLSEDWEGIAKIVEDPKSSVLRKMICSVIAKAVKKGDAHAMSIILEQVAGKPRQRIEHVGEVAVTHFTPSQARRVAELILETES